tara:strand:- start:52 stop:741 length:690 start_codon:yes stop_codon:yes gene_type:complete
MKKNNWELLDLVIAHSPRILLYGVAGTGKTYQANTLKLKKNQNSYNTTLTADSTASELMGHYIATDKGGFVWKDGVGIKSWKEGARLVINEIDHAGVDVMTFLHALLDDKEFAKFTLPNMDKETVRPDKNFQVIATMNGTPDDLPEPLADRFPIKLEIDEVHPSALASLPAKLKAVYYDYNNGQFSVRKWIAFKQLLDSGVDEQDACSVVFKEDAVDILEALGVQDVII